MTEAPTPNEMTVRIEALSLETLHGANVQANSFMAAGKGMCFGICSFRCCPSSDLEFGAIYRNYPETLETSAVAVQDTTTTTTTSGKHVLGFLQMSLYGQKRNFFEGLLHSLRPGEAYIEQMSVSAECRGQGIGTRLLQWSEETARAKGASVLSLGVVHGNPAERLYKRFGFEDVEQIGYLQSCMVSCCLGFPHGQFGAKTMEKKLDTPASAAG